MSENYDRYHRWEPLAEFHFDVDDGYELSDAESYIYCLCSRVFIRDVVTYQADKDYGNESEVEMLRISQTQEYDDQSHVHFSLDTSYKVKCEKDEGASCYCSASHTENYCSTDEHDPTQHFISHALQPSDSGADLTYQDHSDYTQDKLEKMDQDRSDYYDENYSAIDTWEKFWSLNGERLIWASWIKKYSDYINPEYLNDNNDLIMDENGIPKQISSEKIYNMEQTDRNPNNTNEDSIRERKFSYDSKVNPYKKSLSNHSPVEKCNKDSEFTCDEEDTWLLIGRRRSCSEHDRMLSPRTTIATDSMTNVTKITLSSYDMSSSHVTSESTPSDNCSVSSSTSDEQNDQTKIANIDEIEDQLPMEEMDTEQYWQLLWKKHFGEQYALHYANYVESHDSQSRDLPSINVEIIQEKKLKENVEDIECENSEGISQEMSSVIEMQTKVNNINLEDKAKSEKKDKLRKKTKKSSRYLGSVGVLLQSLLKEEQKKNELEEDECKNDFLNQSKNENIEMTESNNEVFETGDSKSDKSKCEAVDNSDCNINSNVQIQQSISNNFSLRYNYDDGDDEREPEEKAILQKRSHELDLEETASEKIMSTFEVMGFCTDADNMPKGSMVYRKRLARLRPPRNKNSLNKKIFFDDDGNPISEQSKDSNEVKEVYTHNECEQAKSEFEAPTEVPIEVTEEKTETECEDSKPVRKRVALEASKVPLPDFDTSFSDVQDNNDDEQDTEDAMLESKVDKKRRRQSKKLQAAHLLEDCSDLPPELEGDPKMLKYWKKRHSLFHRFDDGIRLDRESWFSVTPENVARHIAKKCTYNVVLDAFCGAGGNAIQFALSGKTVIAVDIDPVKIQLAKHNATVYGVLDRIIFLIGDFFRLAPIFKADMVFLSPPWGGPQYSQNHRYDIETMLEPRPATELMAVARTISSNIVLYLPRNTRADQMLKLAQDVGGCVEIEQSYLGRRFVAITAYYYK